MNDKNSRASGIVGFYTVLIILLLCASVIICATVAKIFQEKGYNEGIIDGSQGKVFDLINEANNGSGYISANASNGVIECFVVNSTASKNLITALGSKIR